MTSQLREFLAQRYRRARWIGRRAATGLRERHRLGSLPVVFANAIPKNKSKLRVNTARGWLTWRRSAIRLNP